MLRGSQSPSTPSLTIDAPLLRRKRPAESQDNERLSKRLSLLNLEQNGSKLYVPVETPSAAAQTQDNGASSRQTCDDAMQLEDSKHKVYIYNIDDELSDESDNDEGKLVFLPDIEKHLRETRIPPHVLVNKDGELAGMQMVLYNDPKSLSVPESKDSVRKAIIESRHRHRETQRLERLGIDPAMNDTSPLKEEVMEVEPITENNDSDAMEMD
ncbi:hypothetical protein HJFPF1_01261 [Paramyrothecium foliicola]|nr:hypothetical protein HJFPF1_01261 [Paramyrothecium foliicola]